MSNVFGGGGDGGAAKKARQLQERQAAEARRQTQTANEETQRATQRAERGSGVTGSEGGRGRDMLIGNLSTMLSKTLGGGGQ